MGDASGVRTPKDDTAAAMPMPVPGPGPEPEPKPKPAPEPSLTWVHDDERGPKRRAAPPPRRPRIDVGSAPPTAYSEGDGRASAGATVAAGTPRPSPIGGDRVSSDAVNRGKRCIVAGSSSMSSNDRLSVTATDATDAGAVARSQGSAVAPSAPSTQANSAASDRRASASRALAPSSGSGKSGTRSAKSASNMSPGVTAVRSNATHHGAERPAVTAVAGLSSHSDMRRNSTLKLFASSPLRGPSGTVNPGLSAGHGLAS